MLGCDVEQGKTVAEGDSAPTATAKDAEKTAAAKTPIRNAEPADIKATIGSAVDRLARLRQASGRSLTTSAEAGQRQGPTAPRGRSRRAPARHRRSIPRSSTSG